ncbi:hypothetical protein [Mycobacterium sp. E1319]|uniref:hypothetical protein n=1 Tax=Mycobacterium sp. E1319 TaxID=1834124 RepID=UPI000B32BCD6|nr:hypothetical protein [Mycobacterium sp. E1319]
MVGVILAYPWFFVPVLVVACAVVVDRRMRQRAAIAARADWEHRALMAKHFSGLTLKRQFTAPPVFFGLPRKSRSRCAADHWSKTEPLWSRG